MFTEVPPTSFFTMAVNEQRQCVNGVHFAWKKLIYEMPFFSISILSSKFICVYSSSSFAGEQYQCLHVMTDYFFVTNLDLDFEGGLRPQRGEEGTKKCNFAIEYYTALLGLGKGQYKEKAETLLLYTVNEFEILLLFFLLIF